MKTTDLLITICIIVNLIQLYFNIKWNKNGRQ
jgi:hypothetical protein